MCLFGKGKKPTTHWSLLNGLHKIRQMRLHYNKYGLDGVDKVKNVPWFYQILQFQASYMAFVIERVFFAAMVIVV